MWRPSFSSTYLKAIVDSLLKQRQMLYGYYTSKTKEEKNVTLLEQLTLKLVVEVCENPPQIQSKIVDFQ